MTLRKAIFFKYFVKEFHNLKLKKVIASCFVETNYNLFNINEKLSKAKYSVYQGEPGEPIIKNLRGDGDFRSQESIEFLKEADIVITNPPFSLFKEYVEQLMKYDKKFLIIGNTNAITYKQFFHFLKNKKVWPSYTFNKSIEFLIPDKYETWDRTDEYGNKYATVPAITWWTNLPKNPEKPLIFTEKYNENNYMKYINYNAIDVRKISDIPVNFKGTMGVPITFIGQWDPEEFELIGLGAGTIFKELGGKTIGEKFLEEYFKNGGSGNYVANQYILAYYDNQGKPSIPYMRLLIRKGQ